MSQAGMSQAGSSAMSMPRGAAADLNDIDYDAFLANERTLADPEVVRVSAGARVRLRIIKPHRRASSGSTSGM
jgi:hypothetical protein